MRRKETRRALVRPLPPRRRFSSPRGPAGAAKLYLPRGPTGGLGPLLACSRWLGQPEPQNDGSSDSSSNSSSNSNSNRNRNRNRNSNSNSNSNSNRNRNRNSNSNTNSNRNSNRNSNSNSNSKSSHQDLQPPPSGGSSEDPKRGIRQKQHFRAT